jgi:hypothetical protein
MATTAAVLEPDPMQQHRPSDDPTGALGSGWRRAGGAAALTFAGLVIVDNIARATMPGPGAGIAEVVSWYRSHQTESALAAGTFAINLVALLSFAAVISRRTAEAGGPAAIWARLGVSGAGLVAAFFGITTVLDAALSQSLTAGTDVFSVVWRIHWTLFTVNLAAIGVALLGLSVAARSAGLIPRWAVATSVFGAAVLIAAATPLVLAASGVAVFQAALPGFAMWLLFLVVSGVGLLRDRQ